MEKLILVYMLCKSNRNERKRARQFTLIECVIAPTRNYYRCWSIVFFSLLCESKKYNRLLRRKDSRNINIGKHIEQMWKCRQTNGKLVCSVFIMQLMIVYCLNHCNIRHIWQKFLLVFRYYRIQSRSGQNVSFILPAGYSKCYFRSSFYDDCDGENNIYLFCFNILPDIRYIRHRTPFFSSRAHPSPPHYTQFGDAVESSKWNQ